MPEKTIARSTLVAKLAAVMAAVERIPKRGRNAFHGYDYATEADIVSAIRGELASRQVILLPAITGAAREPVGDPEKRMVLTSLTMEFTFSDGESGETITRPWLGCGTDKEDKGAYKAMTGGEKYFLLKTFLMPTGDDPEQDGKVAEVVKVAQVVAARPLPAAPPPRAKAAAVVQVAEVAEVVKVAALPGYTEWLMALVGVAGAGTKQLEAMWYASSKDYRQQLVDTAPTEWVNLKAKAARVAA